MEIRAVYFDFGGVLYQPPTRCWMRRWQRLLGLQGDETFTAMIAAPEESPFVQAVMEGHIPEGEIWQRLGRRWRLAVPLVSWLQHNAISRRRMNREVATFLTGLRPRYKTAILSNAGSDTRRTFTEVFGFQHMVDEIIISAEEGIAKPDERIYQIALDRFGITPQEALFLDDLAVNVVAARRLGMRAVQFHHTRQALDDVSRCLNNGSRA
jgi:epoxide hydrolase-like predicted phosphatase